MQSLDSSSGPWLGPSPVDEGRGKRTLFGLPAAVPESRRLPSRDSARPFRGGEGGDGLWTARPGRRRREGRRAVKPRDQAARGEPGASREPSEGPPGVTEARRDGQAEAVTERGPQARRRYGEKLR